MLNNMLYVNINMCMYIFLFLKYYQHEINTQTVECTFLTKHSMTYINALRMLCAYIN